MFALSIRGNRDIRDILRLRNLETLLFVVTLRNIFLVLIYFVLSPLSRLYAASIVHLHEKALFRNQVSHLVLIFTSARIEDVSKFLPVETRGIMSCSKARPETSCTISPPVQ